MGFLKNLKNQVADATKMASDYKANVPAQSMTSMGPAAADHAIINETPQEQVDVMLLGSGSARGVVLGAHNDLGTERSMRTRAHVRVRPRLAQGALGDEVKLSVWVNWKVAVLLDPGLEIPIELDRRTLTVTAIDTKELERELEPRFGEAEERLPGTVVDLGLDGITQLPGVVKDFFQPTPPPPGMNPDDPLLEPIDGVALDQFIGVKAEISTKASPEGFGAVAERHGIAASQWESVDAAWMQRVMRSPALAQHFGTSLEAARKNP
jgi:hypothetical protein